jgi:hypothetical protein
MKKMNNQLFTRHLNSLNTNNTTIYDVGYPVPALGETQKYDGGKAG